MFKQILYQVLILGSLISCQFDNNTEKTKSPDNNKAANEALEKANRYLIRAEYEDIENYTRRHQLKMEQTGSGLRFMFLEEGKGPKVESGKTVVLAYNLSLITGDIIYTSNVDGRKIFEVGKGNVESGLEEAMQFLQVGDKVKLILPSHLGYGLLGDNNKIPPRSTLIYDLEVLEIK